jgi:hypothetical protein
MPNPSLIHLRSASTDHFLGLVDLYIALGQPQVYTVEPQITEEYRPDAYTRLPAPVLIELQRSTISSKKMQQKVDQFVKSSQEKKHDARTLLIVTDRPYSIKVPSGFNVVQRSMESFNNAEPTQLEVQ